MGEYVNFEDLSYKELQAKAKLCAPISMPANMRREILAAALAAYQDGDFSRVQNMVNLHKTARKRKMGLKLLNQSISKGRKNKSPRSKSNKDESVADSTSQEVEDITCFNNASTVFTPSNMGFSDLENCPPSNYYCGKVRVNPSQQHQQLVAELEHSNAIDMSNDTHFIGHASSVSYNNQSFDFKNPTSSSTPFDVLKYSSQNPMQYYQQPDVASQSFVHYNCEQVYYPSAHSQSTSYSNNCNANYGSDGSNNYHQLPNYARNSSMSVMQCSNTIANKNNSTSVSSLSQSSSYFSKDAKSMPSLENDYPSPYLPNIPELADVTAENTQTSNFLPSWSQDLHNNESGRSRYVHEAPNQGMMLNSQNLSRKVVDATNTNFIFDKYSDEETLSLNEDVVNLLEGNKTDSQKLNFVPSYGHGGEAYYIRPNKEYINGSVGHICTRPESQNISVESMNGSNSLCPNQTINYSQNEGASRTGYGLPNLSNYSIENIVAPQTPLPPIATLFNGGNHDYAMNSHQSEPHQISCTSLNNTACTDTTFASFTSENETSFVDTCCSSVNSNKGDLNCINLITPTSSPPGNDASDSILRNRLQINKMPNLELFPFGKDGSGTGGSSTLQAQLIGKVVPFKKKTDLAFPSVKAADKSSSILSAVKSMQENKLNVNVTKVHVKANSEFKEEENTDMKRKVGHFIYESETLHRSKIVYNYNILKEGDRMKTENVRKVLQMFECEGLPKSTYRGLQPMTMINTMEEETQKKTNTFAVVPIYHRPCANKKRGCDVVLQADSLIHKHEKRCLFKLISCPSETCTWCNSLKLLTEHIYKDHADEVEKRNQYLYVLDRKKFDDGTLHTYFQVHKKIIYVIQLRIEDNKCAAAIRHIPEMDIVFRQEKPATVMMQMYAFCNKIRMKSWTGVTQSYHDKDESKPVDLMINVRNSEFIGLRIVID